jgi:anti-sigma28 factor (negative regulator of flagellin synthesis)
MRLSIISRVSEILTEKRLNIKLPGKNEPVKIDKVEISSTGNEVKQIADKINSVNAADDVARRQRVEDIKKSVELGQYELSEAVVNSIAEKIAKTLL